MEDQQPASSDLTDAAAAEAVAGGETAAADEAVTGGEAPAADAAVTGGEAAAADEAAADDAAAGAETAAADGAGPGEEGSAGNPSPQPKAKARNKTAAMVIAASAAFIISCGFAAATVEPYLVSRAAVVTKLKIAETAAEAINTLWTYTPEDMERLPDRAAKYLSGDFEDQYRKFVDAIAATNKQAQVSNSTQVVAAAVESVTGDEAVALVYTNTTSNTPQAAIPSMKYVSYRLKLKRQGTRWLVTKMTTVTSLDLTPKL